jgi:hypothetical protein
MSFACWKNSSPFRVLRLHRYQKPTTGDRPSPMKSVCDTNYSIDHLKSSCQSSAIEIVTLFLIGCAIATSHHFYYSHLSQKNIDRTHTTPFPGFNGQKWASHLGTALAFAANFFFAKAVGEVYIQRLWTAARRAGGMSLDSLDAGFDVLHNPKGFLCLDLISSAHCLIILALMSWAMPLLAIIVPGALLVAPYNATILISPCNVPSVNLSTSKSLTTLSLYTTRASDGNSYLISPSPQMQQLATLALLSGTYSVPESPCGSICTYNTSFFAPYFNCTKPLDIGKPRKAQGGVYFWNATSRTGSGDRPDQLYIDWYGDRQAAIIGGPPNSTQDQARRVICTATNASYTFYIRHNPLLYHNPSLP